MLDAQPETVYNLINDLIIPVFDFNNMSRWILGKYWKQASEEQRIVFTTEFKNLLVRTYAKAVLGFSNERVELLSTQTNPKNNMVKGEYRDNLGCRRHTGQLLHASQRRQLEGGERRL